MASSRSKPSPTPDAGALLGWLQGGARTLALKLGHLSDALRTEPVNPMGAVLCRAEDVRIELQASAACADLIESLVPDEWAAQFAALSARSAHQVLRRMCDATLRRIRRAYLVENAGINTAALAWRPDVEDTLLFPFVGYRDHLFGLVAPSGYPPVAWEEGAGAELAAIGRDLPGRRLDALADLVAVECRCVFELIPGALNIFQELSQGPKGTGRAGIEAPSARLKPVRVWRDPSDNQHWAVVQDANGNELSRGRIGPKAAAAVGLLVGAFPEGLTTEAMAATQTVGDPRKSIQDAISRLPELGLTVVTPGRRGRGVRGTYRLRWPAKSA